MFDFLRLSYFDCHYLIHFCCEGFDLFHQFDIYVHQKKKKKKKKKGVAGIRTRDSTGRRVSREGREGKREEGDDKRIRCSSVLTT